MLSSFSLSYPITTQPTTQRRWFIEGKLLVFFRQKEIETNNYLIIVITLHYLWHNATRFINLQSIKIMVWKCRNNDIDNKCKYNHVKWIFNPLLKFKIFNFYYSEFVKTLPSYYYTTFSLLFALFTFIEENNTIK